MATVATSQQGFMDCFAAHSFGARKNSIDCPSSPSSNLNYEDPKIMALIDEFRTLQLLTDKQMSFGERILYYPSATTFWTSPKNRYPDVLPKECTRVQLSTNGCDGNDYINANYIFDKSYIATQAPLPSTCDDFWRMIWEQGSTVIVMLTKLMERNQVRAHEYWPSSEGDKLRFGSITVHLVQEINVVADAVIMRLCTISNGTQTREVTQLHFTGWPDFGVPTATKEVLTLIKMTNFFRTSGRDKPLVVHCSAGVGRAGAFIALHKACEQVCAEETPKVLDLVYAMRQCRSGMVQTDDQYVFIHRALQDYIAQRSSSALPVGAPSSIEASSPPQLVPQQAQPFPAPSPHSQQQSSPPSSSSTAATSTVSPKPLTHRDTVHFISTPEGALSRKRLRSSDLEKEAARKRCQSFCGAFAFQDLEHDDFSFT